jgi:hypothetical protein
MVKFSDRKDDGYEKVLHALEQLLPGDESPQGRHGTYESVNLLRDGDKDIRSSAGGRSFQIPSVRIHLQRARDFQELYKLWPTCIWWKDG